MAGAAVAVVRHHRACHLGVPQPGLDRRHAFQGLRVEHGAHRPAVGVAADDDVVHAQRQHSVFDGGGDATVHLPVGRHHVADVAGDEQVAGELWVISSGTMRESAQVMNIARGRWLLASFLNSACCSGKTSRRKCWNPSTILFNASSALSCSGESDLTPRIRSGMVRNLDEWID